jgi:ABC-type branched-subunit amino acid transport system substrate-binding protein
MRTSLFGSRARLTRRVAALACTAALALTASACSKLPAPTPWFAPQGVSATEILLGEHAALTGPAAAGYSKVSAALKAYFDHVNDHGGVYGRQLKLLVEDDAYDPAKTQTAVRKLVEEDKVFAIVGGLGTATHSAVLDYLKDQQIPDLFVASGASLWNQPARYPGTFGFQTDYTSEGKIIGSYLKTNLSGQKICGFGQEGAYGDALLAGVETGFGSALVKKQSYISSNPDVAPQVQALQVAGCQVVVLGTTPSFTAQTISTASKLNFAPQWVASTAGSDYGTVSTALGAYKGLLEGLISTGYLPISSDATDPWVKLFAGIWKDKGDGSPVDNNVMVGMSIGYVAVQALQRAGKDITVDGLISAIEQGGFRGPGLVPFAFSATSHAGYSGGRMSKVTNGVQEYFGPAYVTDAGSAEITEYTDPAIAPPADGIPTT